MPHPISKTRKSLARAKSAAAGICHSLSYRWAATRSKNSRVPISASLNFVPHGCACQNSRTRSFKSELVTLFEAVLGMDSGKLATSQYKLKAWLYAGKARAGGSRTAGTDTQAAA